MHFLDTIPIVGIKIKCSIYSSKRIRLSRVLQENKCWGYVLEISCLGTQLIVGIS